MKLIRLLKNEWLQIIILIAPFVIIAIFWDRIPERVPIHWNFKGNVNGYAGKSFGLFFTPILNIGLALLLGGLARFDPKAYKMNLPGGALKPLRLIITGFLFALFCLTTLAPELGIEMNMSSIIQIALPLLFLLIGNFLPAVKPNYFIGVRTPWTLESPENWRLTHKFAGRLWVIASIVFIVINFLLPEDFREYAFMVYLGVIILPPLVYSYLIFQKSKRSESANVQEQA